MKKNQLLKSIKILFPFVLMLIAGIEIHQFLTGIEAGELKKDIASFSFIEIALLLILTCCAIVPMFFYDAILLQLLRARMPLSRLLRISFIANSFSNLIGFGGFAGAALRTYFYRGYEQDKRVLLKTIASVSLFYLTGISLLAGIIAAGFRNYPLLHDVRWLTGSVFAVSLYLPGYLYFTHRRLKNNREKSICSMTSLRLVTVSLMEWIAIYGIIVYLASILQLDVSPGSLFPVFIIASCAGILSMIPGGLGSFDLVFIWGTQELGIPDEKVLVLLLLYRVGYLLLPFIFAALLLMKEYIDKLARIARGYSNSQEVTFSSTSLINEKE
ncbi:lysylphosphatidylglycerol synthase domain-containing protein [Bacillus massilinigeriensis]|uniref:lysylphosphatidylglycerol synthase domain-containing protein n=1 Tax=Bacillus mediterraneensis TaxID=1805474 RepID=UPI0008F92948|nr:lysylphosphatidylglycerol synthase domain-containing protein [Bacillus mediterraneensis]